MWKQFVNDYLSYTYKERTGIVVLLALIGICIFAPLLYPWFITKKRYDHRGFRTEIAQLQLAEADSFNKYPVRTDGDESTGYVPAAERDHHAVAPAEVFYFDPNTATPGDWKRLGIKDKTVETIQKYLSKGGHFYKPEDIGKIWGLHADDIKRLSPYVSIPQKANYVKKESGASEIKRAVYRTETFKLLDINSADTAGFTALPGIGSKLAQRIINFRSKLGGFYSVEQVGETFGLPDSTFQKIKPALKLAGTTVKKIDINTALLDDLKTHPYIRYALANAIIQYRARHGNFSSVAEVKKIMLVTDNVFNKIEPYLTVSP